MIEVQETRDPRSILRAKREIAKFNRRNLGDLEGATPVLWVWIGLSGWISFLVWLFLS